MTFSETFLVFLVTLVVFLGVKFGFRKSCLCKRNDKYEVCLSLTSSQWEIAHIWTFPSLVLVFLSKIKKAVVVYLILRWPCWCYHFVFLPYCMSRKSVVQKVFLLILFLFFDLLIYFYVRWVFVATRLQLRHSEVAWLSWESGVQDQLNDIW